MRRTLVRWLTAGLLGAALALGSFTPALPNAISTALAADPGGAGGGGG